MRLKTSFRVKKSGNMIFHSRFGDFYLMENFCEFDRIIFFFIQPLFVGLIEYIKSLKFLTCCVNLRNIIPKCAQCVKQVAPPIMQTRDRQHFLHTKIEKTQNWIFYVKIITLPFFSRNSADICVLIVYRTKRMGF